MGQIEDLRMFVAIIDNGGIAKTATNLNLAKSAVSRRLVQLEDRYGVKLIDRNPRLWKITTAGQELYQRAIAMVANADDLDADFQRNGHALCGSLAVSVALEFGLSHLKPVLCEFMENHPEIDLKIDFDDRIVDVERENYDLAVRITKSHLTGLNHHFLGVTRHGLFASPSYAERHGLPTDLSDLKTRPLLHYGAARRAKWDFLVDGRKKVIEFQPALNSNSGAFLVEAAVNGFGIIRLPDFIVAEALARKALVPVLQEIEIAEYGIYAVHAANRRLNKRMRALIDVLDRCA